MRAWVTYSVLRVGLILVIFALLLIVSIQWWLAAIVAAVVAFCISYIFFGKLRAQVATELATRRRVRVPDSDEDVEDGPDSEGQSRTES